MAMSIQLLTFEMDLLLWLVTRFMHSNQNQPNAGIKCVRCIELRSTIANIYKQCTVNAIHIVPLSSHSVVDFYI